MAPPTPPDRPIPRTLRRVEGKALEVEWRDGHRGLYPMRLLRGICPCAVCVDETTGVRRPLEVPPEIGFADVWLVGNYAVGIRFSDGHDSGIFTYDALRRACPCRECAGGAGR